VWRDDDGDGVNELHHDLVTTTNHPDAGRDSLVLGPGIRPSDIVLWGSGNDLNVGVMDAAHSGAPLAEWITLRNWTDANDRIESWRFADGTTLDLSGAGLAAFLVPFGAALSQSSVVERSAIGTVVGTVTGFDFAGAGLSYSMIDGAGGRFAIDASTGVLTVAGAINYDDAASWQIVARVSDGAHVFDKAFTINVIDIPNRAPVLSVPATVITTSSGQSLQMSSLFTASDADGDALTYYFQDATTAANSGYFAGLGDFDGNYSRYCAL
jgi:hypothetical protein